jgi:hypothetical protein
MGEEAVFYFEMAVGRLRVNVASAAGAGFYFIQFICGRSVKEVTDAFLTFVCDGVGGHIIGIMEEGLGEGKWAEFSAAATEGFNKFTGLLESQVVSGEVLGVAVFSGRVETR